VRALIDPPEKWKAAPGTMGVPRSFGERASGGFRAASIGSINQTGQREERRFSHRAR